MATTATGPCECKCMKSIDCFPHFLLFSISVCAQCVLPSHVHPLTDNNNDFPWYSVQAMVSHGRVELLAHPLSQKYLQMKWNSYGKYFHVTNLLIYTVFLMFVTIYASQLMQCVNQNAISESALNETANEVTRQSQYSKKGFELMSTNILNRIGQ